MTHCLLSRHLNSRTHLDMSVKRRRTELTLKEKYDIVLALESGSQQKDLVEKYGLSKSAVSMLSQRRAEIKAKFQESVPFNPDRKRFTLSLYPDVEKRMNEWMRTAIGSVELTDHHLLLQAREFAEKCDISRDCILEGWITRWKARYGFSLKRLHRESVHVIPLPEPPFRSWQESLVEILTNYLEADVYNWGESGLFWKMLPAKNIAFLEEDEMPNDRLTILFMVSMAGEKEPPLVVGKSANPHCFAHATPPIQYTSNCKAWMTEEIFEQTVQRFDQRMREQGRQVALVLDASSAHHSQIPGLTNLKLYFSPAKFEQPLHAGIIRSFKANYRRRMAVRQYLCWNDKEVMNLTLLDALYFIKAAWNDVSVDTIKNCFKKTGFHHGDETLAELEFDPEQANIWGLLRGTGLFPKDLTVEQYITVDDDLPTSGIKTEDEIVKIENKEVADNHDETGPGVSVPSHSVAFNMINDLQHLLVQMNISETTKESIANSLNIFQDCIAKDAIQNVKQETTPAYFHHS